MAFGITELLVILAIVVLLFGTGKIKSIGTDIGSAIKGFRGALSNDDDKTELLADEERPLNDINAQSKQHIESKVESKAEPKKDQT